VSSIAISHDTRTIVRGSYDETIEVWNALDGTLLRTLKGGHKGGMINVALSPDGRIIVNGSMNMTGRKNKTIEVWNALDGALLRTLKEHKSEVCSVAFSPDGRTIVSGDWDGTLKVWGVR
jgi:WD40 repeat protein